MGTLRRRRNPVTNTKGKPEPDALDWLLDRYVYGKPELERMYAEARTNSKIAGKVYDLREEAKLTQAELAKLVGTSPSVISRLEDPDYEGHSLTMLSRIAAALGKEIEISFVDIRPKPRKGAPPKRKPVPATKRRRAATPAA